MSKVLYCIPGLGADERLFSKIKSNEFQVEVLNWIEPGKDETLNDYAKRFANYYLNLSEPIYLLGVSFGGVLAQEISRLIKIKKLILVSSFTSTKELTRISPTIKLNKSVPTHVIKYAYPLSNYFFTAKTTESKQLVSAYHSNLNKNLFRWSLDQILFFEPIESLANYIRIHGEKDKLVPRPHKVDYLISNAGHLLIFENGEEVSEILQSLLVE